MPAAIEKLQDLKARAARSLLAAGEPSTLPRNHYVGVGIGHKNGDPNADYALRIYVRRKMADSEVAPAQLIKGLMEGMMTDVAEVKPFTGYVSATGAGSGVQFQSQYGQGPVGTLGAVLVDTSGQQYALSANHVVSRNGSLTSRGGFSLVDTGEAGPVVQSPVVIGSAVTSSPLKDGCTVDCAVVKAAPGVALKQRFPSAPGTLTTAIATPVIGRPAAKLGHATQWTKGIVGDQFADVRLDCGPGLGVITISDVVLVRDEIEHDGLAGFAGPGDSGSLVFQQEDNGNWSPVGLVIGGPVRDPRAVTPTKDYKGEDYIAVCRLDLALALLNSELYPSQPTSTDAGGLTLAEFELK